MHTMTATVVAFKRRAGPEVEKGIVVKGGRQFDCLIVDVNGDVVQEIWTYIELPYEGCISVEVG